MNWELFTKCFVSTVEERALKLFGDNSKFARAAWPDAANAPVLWRTIRNGRSNTGVRDIYTKDMVNMANALGERLSSLVFAVEEKINAGWTPDADAKTSKKRRTSRNASPVEEQEIKRKSA